MSKKTANEICRTILILAGWFFFSVPIPEHQGVALEQKDKLESLRGARSPGPKSEEQPKEPVEREKTPDIDRPKNEDSDEMIATDVAETLKKLRYNRYDRSTELWTRAHG